MRVLTAGACVLLVAIAMFGGAQAQTAAKSIADFNWQIGEAVRHVGDANATFKTARNEAAALGPEATRVMQFLQGTSGYQSTSAVVLTLDGPMADAYITIDHQKIGHVSDEDWRSVDADGLISEVRANTERDNKERIKNGSSPLTVLGWSEKPTYDPYIRTMHWAIKATSQEGQVVNVVAIKLSKDGFSRITWIGAPEQFLNSQETIKPILARYDFNSGYRYADFKAGDIMAGVTIAGLTATLVTGKAGKAAAAGAVAVALVFAKKLWFLALLPFVWVWRRVFRKKPNQQASA